MADNRENLRASQLEIVMRDRDDETPRSSLDGLLHQSSKLSLAADMPNMSFVDEPGPAEPSRKPSELKRSNTRAKSPLGESNPSPTRHMHQFEDQPRPSMDGTMPEPFAPYTPRHARFTALAPSELTYTGMDKHPHKQLKLFVMEIREDGSKTTREMRRTDILREVRDSPIPIPAESLTSIKGLTQLRDLRHIDPTFALQRDPGLLVRRHAILLHLNPVEAIILHNKCFIFIPPGRHSLAFHNNDSGGAGMSAAAMALTSGSPHLTHDSGFGSPGSPGGNMGPGSPSAHDGQVDEPTIVLLQDVVERLNNILTGDLSGIAAASSALPLHVAFEFKALEAILVTVCKHLDSDVVAMEPRVKALLAHLSRTTSTTRLERLRRLKIDLTHYESHARGLRKAITDVLETDEDMAYMHLSRLHKRPDMLADGDYSDHEEVELLLEAYLMELDNTITRIGLLLKEIDNTEGLITLLLYSSSNQLLKLDVVMSLMAVSIGVGTLLVGIFGMNLRNGKEHSHGAFLTITIATIVGVLVLTLLILFYVKRAKKIDNYM